MDKSDKKGKKKDDPDKKRDRKSPSTKHSTPTNERPNSPCLGKCIECGHMGKMKLDCKQCEGEMWALCDFDEDGSVEKGFDFSDYIFCEECLEVKLSRNQHTRNFKICPKCFQDGWECQTEAVPGSEVEKQCREQKCLPRCALVPFNKCNDCLETADFLGSNMPVEINMASNILTLCRAYDALVERGYNLSFDKKQRQKKTKFLFKPTSLDLTTEKLQSLIEHHHKSCLCSICKFWIISNAEQNIL